MGICNSHAAFRSAKPPAGTAAQKKAAALKKQAAKRSYQGIETIIRALETAKVRISANVNFDLVIELLLLTID